MDFHNLDTIERVLEEIPSCIFFKDQEGRYVFATHYWNHLNGSEDENFSIEGKTDLDIRKDKENARKAMEADRRILETGVSTEYIICEETDGAEQYLQLIKRPVRDDEGNIIGIVGLINDVTKQVMLEKQLSSYMRALKIESETDPLTQINNRRSGRKGIEERQTSGIFCLFDIDSFKTINDNFGHDVGDEVLVEVANIMKRSFRETDILTRLGGDEFSVFIPGVDTEDLSRMILDRFFSNIASMKVPRLKDHKVTISMGVYFTNASEDVDTMYKKADEVMYIRKKQKGGDGYDYVNHSDSVRF